MPRSMGDALAAFQRANRLDPGFATAATWTCRLGPLTLRLPNFRWRRDAIQRHDLHHVITGYPCSMRGEFKLAAWEFAAGRYPHPAATLFCLPLVAAGMIWSPGAIWRAFHAGRRSRSLYGAPITPALLHSPVDDIGAKPTATPTSTPRLADAVAFCGLVLAAGVTVLTPLAAAGVLLLVL